MADIFEIAGRIHSTSQEKVAVTADEVLDGTKKQSQINTETYGHVESIDNALANLSPEQQEALGVAAKATNNESNIGFYVCDTAAGTAAKAITSANYVLTVGGSIKIKFEHANSAASGVTLKVGSAMAKPLYYDGSAVSVNNTWEDNETVEVYYDGTNYYANNVAGGGGDGVFDVSEKYPTSGVDGGNTYTLEGALAVLNANLPASKKKGGMSIKYVDSSDNKYVQYRLMSPTWSTVVTDWQGVDAEPTAGSTDLAESGGIHLLDFAKPYIHAYAGNAEIGGKYYGKYCSNVNTGAISNATDTRNSYLIQATAGIKYLIICPSRVYSGIQFFDEDFGFVGSVSFNASGITAPPDSRYMMIVVNPSLEDHSCTIKALEIIDEEKLSSSLKTKINLPLTGYIYDVSQKFPTGGISGGNTYTLQVAIDIIPSADRYAGMTIRFIDNETQLYQKWMFIGKTVNNNTWNVYNFENCDKEDNYVIDGLQSYSGSINLNGKYYGLYCLNVNTGEQRIATETRNSYLLRIIPGQRYKITCPCRVYEYWLQFYKSKPKQSNSAYSETEGYVGKDKPTDGVFVAPATAHYLSVTVNTSLEDQNCIVEALKTVNEDKLNDELKEKINNPVGLNSKGFLYGKKLVTLCDSFGEGGTWQSKLVELTGCVWDSELNYQHYSRGGTKTLYAHQQLQDGQGRAKLLVDENLVTPDVIIYENMNDNSGLVTGTSADEPFFRYSQQLITPSSAIASQADVETYWNNNLLAIVGGITPHNGVILGVPYSASNGVKLKITGTPTQNGTFIFRIGTGYGITLTTSDTISDIVRKILEYDYYGYLDTVDPSDDSAVIFNNLDGTTVGELTVLSNTAGITYEITSNVPGQLAVWKYFYGHDLTKWTNGEYWRNEITRWSMWKGVIEYLQTSFPLAMIYWMLPRTYNFDYNNLPAAALFPDGSVNYSYIYENYNLYESICEIERQFCEFYHIPLLDLPAYSGINPMNAPELCNAGNVHPKDAAYNRWAEIIAQQIN